MNISHTNAYHTNAHQQPAQGITRYYERRRANDQHGATYYITPKDTCPLDVLNQAGRFVVVCFDPADDYLVVDGRRYYLTPKTAIKATPNHAPRVAIVDIDELEHTKYYDFKPSYTRHYTAIFKDFAELRALAQYQWNQGGAPWLKQTALCNGGRLVTYYYETSFSHSQATRTA